MQKTTLPGLVEIEQAATSLSEVLTPTPQISWPLLNERCGTEVWIKHENHNPTGSFKVRGGLIYMHGLSKNAADIDGVCAATRGNHGQSVAFAASRYGLKTVIVVPENNNPEKNEAMRALGAELMVHGHDFDESVEFAAQIAKDRRLHLLPSFHTDLVMGVATYALEFFQRVPDLDRIYVPVGLGSGICGVIAARNALGLETEIVGVVSENANTYPLSFAAGSVVGTNSADTIADGLAVRNANPTALALMQGEVHHFVEISDKQVLDAVAALYVDTHNVAEGAGAAALAALLQDKAAVAGLKTGVVLSGGNLNRALMLEALG